jgi:hypothetical protein
VISLTRSRNASDCHCCIHAWLNPIHTWCTPNRVCSSHANSRLSIGVGGQAYHTRERHLIVGGRSLHTGGRGLGTGARLHKHTRAIFKNMSININRILESTQVQIANSNFGRASGSLRLWLLQSTDTAAMAWKPTMACVCYVVVALGITSGAPTSVTISNTVPRRDVQGDLMVSKQWCTTWQWLAQHHWLLAAAHDKCSSHHTLTSVCRCGRTAAMIFTTAT